MKIKIILLLIFLLPCFSQFMEAKVKLPTLISDGMVLQREKKLCIWGNADPKENVEIIFQKKKYETTTDSSGCWEIQMPPMKAGGPYTMTVNDITINNILIGDVWLCSGQSNMELNVSRVTDLFREEIERDSNPMIRHIKIPLSYNFHSPLQEVSSTIWKEMTPKNALSFSALAYFFAKDIYDKTKVPQGLINSSAGGTPVEAWISEDGLKEFPLYLNDKEIYESDEYIAQIKALDLKRRTLWNNTLYLNDKGLHSAIPWYSPELNDFDWSETDMFSTAWATDGVNAINGSHWLRKEFVLSEQLLGKDAVLRLGCIEGGDSTFVNGVFVGTISYQYPPRIYKVPANILRKGKNVVTIRIISSGGKAAFVKDKPYKLIFGNEEVSLEGKWKHRVGCPMQSLQGSTSFQNKPVGLYNSMIAPLKNYNIKGVIWNQGESNTGRYYEYADLLTSMINDWRNTWNEPELPFIIVQLANFMQSHKNPYESSWAQLRNAQFQVTRNVPQTALVTTIDLGEWNDIHPLNKKEVGRRISLQVQNIAFGNNKITPSGPLYESSTIEGNKIFISFKKGTDNLLQTDNLKGFSIAGKDRKFRWATAKIEGNKVVVWNDDIKEPECVRYGWDDNPDYINLKNKAGLPASPFQTD